MASIQSSGSPLKNFAVSVENFVTKGQVPEASVGNIDLKAMIFNPVKPKEGETLKAGQQALNAVILGANALLFGAVAVSPPVLVIWAAVVLFKHALTESPKEVQAKFAQRDQLKTVITKTKEEIKVATARYEKVVADGSKADLLTRESAYRTKQTLEMKLDNDSRVLTKLNKSLPSERHSDHKEVKKAELLLEKTSIEMALADPLLLFEGRPARTQADQDSGLQEIAKRDKFRERLGFINKELKSLEKVEAREFRSPEPKISKKDDVKAQGLEKGVLLGQVNTISQEIRQKRTELAALQYQIDSPLGKTNEQVVSIQGKALDMQANINNLSTKLTNLNIKLQDEYAGVKEIKSEDSKIKKTQQSDPTRRASAPARLAKTLNTSTPDKEKLIVKIESLNQEIAELGKQFQSLKSDADQRLSKKEVTSEEHDRIMLGKPDELSKEYRKKQEELKGIRKQV